MTPRACSAAYNPGTSCPFEEKKTSRSGSSQPTSATFNSRHRRWTTMSSFSALDIVVHLLWRELNVAEVGWDDPDRDVFFSSKGHDVPGLYAALHALGVIPAERLLRLRRLGGLDGHPDVGVPGIEANSGSLGMGLSKGRGMAWAKRDRKSTRLNSSHRCISYA